ncbi:MAG: sigma-70 family RNA polymerase sigma factor [Trebonia sp.]|jgi:RNA polymerase sigma factor (sigma-70 family)|uniref:sigma-70 family RNA polymerase sigma factor n=1 Tax=Trebonia sp. TaxID=2767075 RepID=UPI002D0409B4|nr:sigma-70 family RNA polymerase sigma factor [Trebonia sp.]
MASPDWLTEGFETNRGRLRAVAYRMLGSLTEADDAVQEAWLRVARADASEVDNLSAWLTTIVARVCLNALRSRNARREEPLDAHVPDPVITRADEPNPEDQALLADSVGLALQVVLETLTPAERLAFVLHDTFGLPFEEIAPMVDRSPAAARQLASRARRRVRGADVHSPDRDVARQREVVDAFFAAAHGGDFDALVAVLDPDVVSRIDAGAGALIPSGVLHGAATVARQTLAIASIAAPKHPVLVNGAAGVVITLGGQPVAVMGFTVSGGKVVEINSIVDPDRIRRLDLSVLGD